MEEQKDNGSISTVSEEVHSYLTDVASGKKFGWTTGFPSLDSYVGRIDKGQVWVIGGYTGTGKSYFILNMIANMLAATEAKPKIAVFSTELSKSDYVLRYIFMKTGVYPLRYQREPEKYYETALEIATEFFTGVSDEELKIYGNIYKLEEVIATIKGLKEKGELPDVVFIDYVQNLSFKSAVKEEDAMAMVTPILRQMAQHFGIGIVLVSQVNIYSQKKDFKQEKTSLAPFSNGKQMSQDMSVGLVLSRKRNNSLTSPHLQADIVKARAGVSARVSFEVGDGYLLKEIDERRAKELDEATSSATTPEQMYSATKIYPYADEDEEMDDTFDEIQKTLGIS